MRRGYIRSKPPTTCTTRNGLAYPPGTGVPVPESDIPASMLGKGSMCVDR